MGATFTSALSKRLKVVRNKLSWTPERLAAELGVSHQTVYRWEKGGAPGRMAIEMLSKKLAEIEKLMRS